jgi:hypothetical protein
MNHKELLEGFKPQLRYDSNEAFFADSAAEWTDNPANSLHRAPSDDRPGELLAAARAETGQAQLDLAFLGKSRYPSAAEVEETDVIGCSRRDYRDQYVALRTGERAYANWIYGRAKEDRGRLWLQYWFFYFYNDYHLAGDFGLHECDWEMVQLRIAEDGEHPDLAVYAQHRWAEVAPWDEVEKLEGRPIVYVGRGSHASYFRSGFHETEAWYDLADGKRETPELALDVLGDDEPSWAAWPGMWGDTRARIPGLETGSPTAPCRHAQWEHPAALLEEARTVTRVSAGPPPTVEISRANGHLQIKYDFRKDAAKPDRLVVTVNSEDDAVQPRTFTLVVDTAPSGTIATAVDLRPTQNYDVYVSAVGRDGRPTESALTLIRPVGTEEPGPVWPLTSVGRIVSAVRRLLGHG